MKPRIAEYENFLQRIVGAGYTLSPLQEWPGEDYHYFLRHDVDKDPEAALILGGIAAKYGQASFYFRWETMVPDVMRCLYQMGHEVSLHYETLANVFRENGVKRVKDITLKMVKEAEAKLADEIALFEILFWPVETIIAHGQIRNRKVGIPNSVLNAGIADYSHQPHNTDTAELSENRYILIHPCHWIVTSRRERLIIDWKDKF